MKLFILLLTLIFTLQIHADDLCYQQPEKGGSIVFPKRLFPIQNISSSSLQNVQVQYAIKGFAMSFNKKIGIDNKEYTNSNDYNSSNGQDKAENADWFHTDFGHGMPDFSIFDKGVNYHLETMASNDVNKIWTSQFIFTDFMSSFFSTKKLFATYTKAGVDYTVILNPCGSEVPEIAVADQTLQSQTTATTMDFNVTISGTLDADVGDDSYIHYYTVDGTATSGSDYTAVNDTITVPRGTTNASISVPISANAGGNFYLILDNAYLARINDGNATGTITQAPSKIGEYRFDLCSPGSMTDSSSSGNDGTIQNVETEDIYPRHEEKGMVCRAGRFYSFVANYLTAGSNLQTDVNRGFSILLSLEWSGNHGDLPIISKANDYSLKINEGKLYYKLGSDSDYTEVPNFSISQNTAYSLAFIATGSQVKVYKDGSITDVIDHNYTHEDNANITYIGTDKTYYYSGLLDEINFYKGVIDSTIITEHAGRTLRPCFCCMSTIKIKGDYVTIGDTYDANRLPWDTVTYDGFRFDEPPLIFMLPSDNGGHSAYIRAKNVTETGFEAANIEPQGEDGPHIAMNLSYIAVNRGVHDLGDHTLEACTIPVQTEQWHNQGTFQDVNLSNRTPYGTISDETSSGRWTKIAVNGTYVHPVVFATIITAENELRDENDNASGREVSRPWMTVAIKNDSSGIWVSLERSETTYGKITKPELIAYMITEGNIQSSFTDDFDNNVSYETIYVKDKFLGYDKKNDSDQRFNFVNTYSVNPKPLVMANKQSRNNPDGGWFRLNGDPTADYLKVSVWEDRRGSFSAEAGWANPNGLTGAPIGVSANQDTERSLTAAQKEDGAAIVFGGTFQYAESYQAIAGSFDAVEQGANFNTILDTKIVNKPFQLKYWSLDKDTSGNTITKVINSPVKVDFIYSQNSGVNLECNNTANLVVPGSTQYANFLQPNPYIDNVSYNITNNTAYRNVQARFTFGADTNGTAVDWLPCYNNSNNCGDSTYTAACTAICTQEIDSARSQACTECYFNHTTEKSYTCSYDRFAIRPDSFDIAINGSTNANQTIVAGTNFLIDANASTYNSSSAAQEYNATQASAGSLSQFHIAPTDLNSGSGCATGLIVDIDDSNFTNGVFSDTDGKYTEVGDINITVFEDPNKVFASVDTGNINASLDSSPSVYTIASNSIEVHFTPDHFKVTSVIKDFVPGYTYISRDLNISSELNVTITAENAENNTTTNYSIGCYSKKTNYNITYNNITIQPASHLSNILFREKNTTVNGTTPINSSMQLLNLNENIFSTADKGTANISIQINFDRDKNESVNPFKFTVKDINVSDSAGILGSELNANKTSTFVYARTNSPRQRFTSPVGTAANPATDFIYYEIYCENGCNKTLLPNGLNSITTDDPRWFVNPGHTLVLGTAGSINQKGFAVGAGRVHGTSASGAAPDSTNLVYDGNKGYTYKTTMENNASQWLIYNKYDSTVNKNEFQVEFNQNGGAWAGKHETNTTTNISGSAKTNRRTMW